MAVIGSLFDEQQQQSQSRASSGGIQPLISPDSPILERKQQQKQQEVIKGEKYTIGGGFTPVEAPPTGVLGVIRNFADRFAGEAKKSAKLADDLIKSQFKSSYSMLSRYAADAYQGDNVVGKIMSVPTMTYILPKKLKNKIGENLDNVAKELQESAFEDLKKVEDFYQENPLSADINGYTFKQKIQNPEFVARGLTLNVPSFLASLGITTIVSLATKNPVVGFTAGFGTGFSLEAGSAYSEALKQDVKEEDARMIGTIVGGINGFLETLFPGKKAADLMGGNQIKKAFVRNLTKEVIKDVTTEGLTESIQEIVSNTAKLTYDENAKILEGTPEAFFFGALMSGITSISTSTFQQLQDAGIEPDPNIVTIDPNKKPVNLQEQAEQKTQEEKEEVKQPEEDIEIEPEAQPEGRPTQVQKISRENMENIKTEKDIRQNLQQVSRQYEELSTSQESKGLFAQEQREGIDTRAVAKLKRIYANSKTFQEGDIETIRSSKHKELVNSVVENVQEKYPEMSESEAFEFALNLPTKADTKLTTAEIRSLNKKQKELGKYLTELQEKQKELNIKESEALQREWRAVMSAQEKLKRIIKVPRRQLPVGEGKKKVSRLEARVTGQLDKIKNMSQEQIDKLGLAQYRELNKKENIRKAVNYVSQNPDEALAVVAGEIDAPAGILRNAVYVALEQEAEGDLALARRLASLDATRAGQEISILSEIDQDSVVSVMREIIQIREETFKKRYKNKTPKQAIDKVVSDIKSEVKAPNRAAWISFLNEIQC